MKKTITYEHFRRKTQGLGPWSDVNMVLLLMIRAAVAQTQHTLIQGKFEETETML